MVKYEEKVVAEVVTKYFPDFRRTLNELQRYSATGQIDSGILSSGNEFSIDKVVGHLRKKEFTNMKKWVSQNMDNDPIDIMRKIYDIDSNFIYCRSWQTSNSRYFSFYRHYLHIDIKSHNATYIFHVVLYRKQEILIYYHNVFPKYPH